MLRFQAVTSCYEFNIQLLFAELPFRSPVPEKLIQNAVSEIACDSVKKSIRNFNENFKSLTKSRAYEQKQNVQNETY